MGFFSKILKPPKPGKFYNPGKNFVDALKPKERTAAAPAISARQQEWMARITSQQNDWKAKVDASRSPAQRAQMTGNVNTQAGPSDPHAAANLQRLNDIRAHFKIDPRNQIGHGMAPAAAPPQMIGAPVYGDMIPGAGVRRPGVLPPKMVGLPAPSAPVAPPQMQYAEPAVQPQGPTPNYYQFPEAGGG